MTMTSFVRIAGRYQLEDTIAVGGFGEVWRATDTVLARPVAVKLLLADHVQDPRVLARFRTEAQRAAGLSHENIARVYDYLEPDPPEPPFLVMELVDGPSAAQVMARGPVDAAWAMHLVAGTAAGLEIAHRAGVVHRDIKPANLLLTRDGRVKVTDFGISYAVNSAPMTSTGMLMGTSGYLAPERLHGKGVTAAADLYALGIVAYECLTGAPPFTGTAIEVAVAHRDQPLPPLPASVPAGVAALIMDLTAKDPAARPGSAGEVASRAAQLRDGLTASSGVAHVSPVDVVVTAAMWAGPGDRSGPELAHGGFTAPQPMLEHGGWAELEHGGFASRGPGLGHGGLASPAPGLEQRELAAAGSGRRAGGARRARGAGLAAAAALVLAVFGLVTARTVGTGSPSHTAAAPSSRATPGVSTVQMIEVNAASLLGQPVDSAARQLRQLGLPVDVTWQASRQQAPGTVLAVQPGGRVAPHTLITLTGARPPGGGAGAVPAGGPSSGAGPGTSPAAHPAPGPGLVSSPANPPSAGTGPGSSATASAGASPSTGTGKGKGKGNGKGGGNGKGNP